MTIRIQTFGAPVKIRGALYATYRGHEWRERGNATIGVSYICAECGAVHMESPSSFPMGDCNPRYAPISWFSESARAQILDEVTRQGEVNDKA